MFKLLTVLLLAFAQSGFSQKPIELKNFSSAQKDEWNKFVEYYNGNGNGTCTPMMETQIDTGKCTGFDFIADLYIGKNGRIYKVVLVKSNVLCSNKIIQKELLDCFIASLKDESTSLKAFRGRIIKNAVL